MVYKALENQYSLTQGLYILRGQLVCDRSETLRAWKPGDVPDVAGARGIPRPCINLTRVICICAGLRGIPGLKLLTGIINVNPS